MVKFTIIFFFTFQEHEKFTYLTWITHAFRVHTWIWMKEMKRRFYSHMDKASFGCLISLSDSPVLEKKKKGRRVLNRTSTWEEKKRDNKFKEMFTMLTNIFGSIWYSLQVFALNDILENHVLIIVKFSMLIHWRNEILSPSFFMFPYIFCKLQPSIVNKRSS